MDPMRKTALVAGLLYLATFVFSIPALGLYDNVVNNPDYVLGSGDGNGALWGGLIEVITGLACIGTAVALYPVAKRYSSNGAVGFLASRILEASMIFVGVISVLSVFTLRQDYAGGDESTVTAIAQALIAVKQWTFLLGPGLLAAVNALCLGVVMYRSRLVPRIIPTIGLVGAPILLASFAATFFGVYDQVSGAGPARRPPHRDLGVLARRLAHVQGLQGPGRQERAGGQHSTASHGRHRLTPDPEHRDSAAAFQRRRCRAHAMV